METAILQQGAWGRGMIMMMTVSRKPWVLFVVLRVVFAYVTSFSVVQFLYAARSDHRQTWKLLDD